MRALLFLPSQSGKLHGLDSHAPLALLPLGDRPFVQHAIEFLVLQGIHSFELILDHAAEQVESYLGDGTRWGCHFRYHLAANPKQPYRCLQVVSEIQTESSFLIHADQFPYLRFAEYAASVQPVLFRAANQSDAVWEGSAIFPPGTLNGALLRCDREQLDRYLFDLHERREASSVAVPTWISARTPTDLLRSQRGVLDRQFADLMIGGTENDPNIRMSRNVTIHAGVKFTAPVYIGANSRVRSGVQIGPYAVISSNCIIDGNTSIQNSLVAAGSYVGEGLELDEVIVSRNLLVNAKLDTSLTVSEAFLLGRLASGGTLAQFRTLLEALFAILLLATLLPFIAVCALYLLFSRQARLADLEAVCLPTEENSSLWRTCRVPFVQFAGQDRQPQASWGAFFGLFLPGLWSVATRRISLVGLPPRTAEEILALPEDWRTLYLNGKTGLITEFSLAAEGQNSEIDIYLAEACYCATRSPKHDAALFCRYFLRLLGASNA